MIRTSLVAVALAAALTLVAACGGGGGGGHSNGDSDRDHHRPTVAVEFPRQPHQHYQASGLPAVSAADAQRMPIYGDGRHLIVGVDQGAQHIGSLPTVGTRNGITIRRGSLTDGADLTALRRYLARVVDDPELRWKSPPVVRFGGVGDQADYERVIRAVQLVNAALPEGAKMRVASNLPSINPLKGIYFLFQEDAGLDYWGITYNSNDSNVNQITHSRITIYKDYTSNGDRQATILLAHELLHALGFFGGSGHVPPDLDSIMEGSSDMYLTAQGIPQPLSLLYPLDREALRALYSRLRAGRSPTDFGPWADTSLHLAGTGQHTAFGVAYRTGYVEPWAYGPKPRTDLASNRALSSAATWTGTLLGFTRLRETVAGDAEIGVNLGTLTGRADFTGLESWDSGLGIAGTGTRWLDGDLGYLIAVDGNTFRETGGDAGSLTGIFTGAAHEGAAGTLERSDLTAAFGAHR